MDPQTPVDAEPPTGQAAPELLERVPEPLRNALSQPGVPSHLVRTTVEAFAEMWAGPLPPADQVQAWERVLPGSADRILAMAERQQAHRFSLEKTTVEGGSRRSWWGLWLGFLISLVVIGVGTGIILTGHTWEGTTIMGVDVVALAGVFVYGRREQRKEREAKDAQSHANNGPPG
jgi:uncharacterized membrane protein